MKNRLFPRLLALVLALTALMALVPAQAATLPVYHKPAKTAPFVKGVDTLDNPPFQADAELLKVDFIDIGLGDAILLRCGGEALLLDGGTSDRSTNVFRFLKQEGVEKLKYLVNSHPHDDHIQTQTKLVESGFDIGEFISGFPENFSYKYQAPMVKALKKRDIPYREAMTGDTITLGGATITFLKDERKKKDKGINDRSMLMHVKFGEATMLLTSDVTGESQGYLLSEFPEYMDVDVVKAPHHGYNFLMKGYLDATTPSVCIITNSRTTARRTESQLNRGKVPRYYLSMGGIHLQTDGSQWYVWQEKLKK